MFEYYAVLRGCVVAARWARMTGWGVQNHCMLRVDELRWSTVSQPLTGITPIQQQHHHDHTACLNLCRHVFAHFSLAGRGFAQKQSHKSTSLGA